MSIKCTWNYDYQWYVNIKKCNSVIQNLGTDVSEKHFRTKSVSAQHPILPLYFNIYFLLVQAPTQILKYLSLFLNWRI